MAMVYYGIYVISHMIGTSPMVHLLCMVCSLGLVGPFFPSVSHRGKKYIL